MSRDDRPADINCHQCHYYMDTDPIRGTCHRFPPVFAGEKSPREDSHWRFPLVSGLSWCGEFLARK